MKLPFSVFLRGNRPYYYVAFKNEETGRYLPAISTKKTKEADAVRQAWVWFREGIPHKDGTLDLKARSLRDTIRHSDISPADAEFIIGELKRRGLVLSCVFAGAADAVRFADFLDEFWNFEHSPYIREKLRAEHSIHRHYAKRHFFTTYMRKKVEDKLLQSQTGHKTIPMLERYSAHLLPGDRDKIREAQREVFSSILPHG